MADLRFHKVTSLPGTPEANAVYYVEVAGDKFDIYVTDNAGNAHSLNQTVPSCCVTTIIVTDNTETMVPDSKYIVDSTDPTVFTLPTTSTAGDTIEIIGINTGTWRINQNAGQVIHFESKLTTTGVSGYVESSGGYDSILMVAIDNNYQWRIVTAVSSCINIF